jgi:DNA polymerase-3 subunit alpha
MEKTSKIPPFVHLLVRSSYSLGEGLSTPAEICAFAARSGYRSLALTDTNHTYGFLEFHREARRFGLKPIYGGQFFHSALADGISANFPFTAIAISGEGLKNLVSLGSLSSIMAESGSALGRDLLELHAGGLVVMLDPVESECGQLIEAGSSAGAKQSLDVFKEIYGPLLYTELREDQASPGWKRMEKFQTFSLAMQVPLVLTEDIRFIGPEKKGVLGLLEEIRHPNKGRDFFGESEIGEDISMKTADEMAERFSRHREAYENTLVIDRLIPGDLLDEWRLHETQPGLRSPVWRFDDPISSFVDKVGRRFELQFHHLARLDLTRAGYVLDREIEQIRRLGLEKTFLIFHEIVSHFRRARIALGPATGLSVQSLCAYLLDITAFNPYQFDDTFQPQLDPVSGRSGLFEVQLGSEDREDAVERLRETFDRHCIAYVPSVEHITPGKALKIAARSLQIEDSDFSEVLKIALQHPGTTLKSLVEESRALDRYYKRSALVRTLLAKAALIEGLPCGYIRSKRSVVVASRPIREFLGYSIDKTTNELFVQATREAFPAAGLYRIDFTPLSALSVCIRTDRELRKHKQKVHTWGGLPVDKKSVWKDIQAGKGTGVYLLESPRIQERMAGFAPQSIEELTHFLALMRLREDETSFAERLEAFQSGTQVDYDYLPELVPLLAKTNGIILYEEQLRDLVSLLTGAAIDNAYRMLESFWSGDPGELAALRREFMKGTADRDVPMEEANQWFERILYYCGRTMSRQRVLADALLVYKAYYLKQRFPLHYYLSLLNTYWNNDTKIKNYLAYLHDLEALLPIDINKSEIYFTLEMDKIRMGLYMVDGVSYPSMLRILKVRGRRKFKSLEAFIRRTKGRGVTVEEVGRLVLLGAFEFTGISRTNLVNALPELFEQPVNGASRGLGDQFELPLTFAGPDRPEEKAGQKENFLDSLMASKEQAGRSDSPEGLNFISSLERFYAQPVTAMVEMLGRISNLQRTQTQSGRVVGFFVLYDLTALVQVFIPTDRYGLFGDELEEGRPVRVRGRVSFRDDRKVCEALEIKPIEAENGSEPGDLGGLDES